MSKIGNFIMAGFVVVFLFFIVAPLTEPIIFNPILTHVGTGNLTIDANPFGTMMFQLLPGLLLLFIIIAMLWFYLRKGS